MVLFKDITNTKLLNEHFQITAAVDKLKDSQLPEEHITPADTYGASHSLHTRRSFYMDVLWGEWGSNSK